MAISYWKFLFLLGLVVLSRSGADVVISEISSSGTYDTCQGNDWIELHNSGNDSVDLSGWVLYDDKGMTDDDAFLFPDQTTIEAGAFMLLCNKILAEYNGNELPDVMSPQFGIGTDDTVTLARVNSAFLPQGISMNTNRNFAYEIVTSVGPMPDTGIFDVTYSLEPSTGQYSYTSTPTPGKENIITELKTEAERVDELKERLARQNSMGNSFFGVDERGYRSPDSMDELLELHITMNEEDYMYTLKNASFEVYKPFQSAKLTTTDGKELLLLDSPGEIRPKGMASLYIAQCVGTETIPFQLDFAQTNNSQTLYGVEKAYLRMHMADYSFMRDWVYNRMLARFGLPHLRTRSVHFFINGDLMGLYSFMEAVDQDYVFARNFPNYDPDNFAQYKIKNLGVDCGSFHEEQLLNASLRINEESTPPYAFERGEHNKKVEVLGMVENEKCVQSFLRDTFDRDEEDVILAYLRHDKDCAKMRMATGLVDLDIGNDNFASQMETFIRDHLDPSQTRCDRGCTNSNLLEVVDVDNFLKTIAFYAVTMNSDSPVGNGNNYYLVQSGDNQGWKMMAYDFNFPEVTADCHGDVCNDRMVYWSILRPTCESLEANGLVGPLLTDESLIPLYLSYVKEFLYDIYANQTFVSEIEDHARSMTSVVPRDFWSVFGMYYKMELDPDEWDWNTGTFPLLPIIKARSEALHRQLLALDAGTFPRMGVDTEAWEPCPDWELSEADKSNCLHGCMYEGCHMAGWTVESFCDEATGVCYQANYDEGCKGIVDGERYEGQENRTDGRETYCRFAQGWPVSVSECPAGGEPITRESSSIDSFGRFSSACFDILTAVALSLFLIAI